jgi:hypothetical protein
MADALTNLERRWLGALERRRDFLARSIDWDCPTRKMDYDRHEHSALSWAIEVIQGSPEAARKIRIR